MTICDFCGTLLPTTQLRVDEDPFGPTEIIGQPIWKLTKFDIVQGETPALRVGKVSVLGLPRFLETKGRACGLFATEPAGFGPVTAPPSIGQAAEAAGGDGVVF